MTNINFYRDKNNNIVKFIIKGHTGGVFGEDIVCAAISAVSNMTLNGISEILGISFGYEISDGHMYFVLPEDLLQSELEKCSILLDSMCLFLTQLEEQYGDRVSISELEV